MNIKIKMTCCGCGVLLDKPYATWHWQTGKPAKVYYFPCWKQQLPFSPLIKEQIEKATKFQPNLLCRILSWLRCKLARKSKKSGV